MKRVISDLSLMLDYISVILFAMLTVEYFTKTEPFGDPVLFYFLFIGSILVLCFSIPYIWKTETEIEFENYFGFNFKDKGLKASLDLVQKKIGEYSDEVKNQKLKEAELLKNNYPSEDARRFRRQAERTLKGAIKIAITFRLYEE